MDDPAPTAAPARSSVAELVAKARKFLLLYDVEGYEEAVPLFRQAIEEEPSFAPAYAGLSETYSCWAFRRKVTGQESDSLYRMAYDLAETALRLAPERADGHRAMAVCLRYGRRKGDQDRRKEEARRAVELDADDPEAWCELWRVEGYELESSSLNRALELGAELCSLHIDLGLVYSERRRYDEAAAELIKALKISPRNSLAFYDLALVLDRQGDRAKAKEVLEKAKRLLPEEPLIDAGLRLLEA